MNTGKKGFTFSLSVISFIMILLVAVIITLAMVLITTFHIYITKKFIIERVLESTQAQDMLLSLLEAEQEGVKFKQAIIYALYENSEKPKIWNGEKIVEYNIEEVAKNFLSYFYESDDYWLFIYDENKDKITTIIASKDNIEDIFKKDFKKKRRASLPLDENKWLILYINLKISE